MTPPLLGPRLFVVLALAKLAVLWGRPVPLSPWMPIAYLWQDAAVALGFIAFERAVGADGRAAPPMPRWYSLPR